MTSLHSNTGISVLVTGANGLIGQAVVRYLLKEGYTVRALVHRACNLKSEGALVVIQGSITDAECMKRAVQGATYVVHLAARKSDEADSYEVNVGGARALLEAAKIAEVKRIMNISTQSVRLPRHGKYAASKAAADNVLQSSSIPITTLRLSVVYGERDEGIFGSLFTFAALPVVPVIGHGEVVFNPIHKDDAAIGIERLMRLPTAEGKTYEAGGREAWTFNELLRECGRRQGRRQLRLVHIPIPIAMMMALVMRILPKPPITVSNVLGSAAIIQMDPSEFLRDAGLSPLSVKEGLDRMKVETQAEREARTLLRYAVPAYQGTYPDKETTKRMLLALDRSGINHALDDRVVRSRWLLGGLDAITALLYPHCILRQKLLIAAAIGECTPNTAAALLPKNRSWLQILLLCVRAMIRTVMKFCTGIPMLLLPSFFRRNAGL